ncbi:MAG TPA: DUF3237 family protein [Lachnospiraceae bacterium]|nr:DUF3237 family protein [Lachnospiraceae bacterium]
MKELLYVEVKLDEINGFESDDKAVTMILFHGEAKGEYFTGTILPGGVDTQIREDGVNHLSARYILEGTDCQNQPCKIFIENNGVPDPHTEGRFITVPKIITDSQALKWFETTHLSGEVIATDEMVMIKIYGED